ncbi:MAG: S26 family signal peptidase [Solirubrobacteraceae bacterium]
MIVLALVLPIPGLILLRAVAVKPYRIPAASMEPTLQVGGRVLVNRTGIGLESPMTAGSGGLFLAVGSSALPSCASRRSAESTSCKGSSMMRVIPIGDGR